MEIDLYSKLQNPIEAIEKLGTFFAKSGMFKCTRTEQGQMLALICVAEKISPTRLMREYHVMDDGTLMPRSRNVHAQFLAAGGDIDWELTGDETTDFDKVVARAKFSFKDKTPRTLSFSTSDARRMQLPVENPKGTWRKSPARMCRARLITMAVDLFCPAIAMGERDDADASDIVRAEPAQSINLGAATADTVVVESLKSAAPVKESKTAKVETPVVPVDAEPVAEVAPTVAPGPAPVVTQSPVVAVTPPMKGVITNELLSKVEEIVGGQHGRAAIAWLRKAGHIKDGQGLESMPLSVAQRIIKHPDKFIAAINGTPSQAPATTSPVATTTTQGGLL